MTMAPSLPGVSSVKYWLVARLSCERVPVTLLAVAIVGIPLGKPMSVKVGSGESAVASVVGIRSDGSHGESSCETSDSIRAECARSPVLVAGRASVETSGR